MALEDLGRLERAVARRQPDEVALGIRDVPPLVEQRGADAVAAVNDLGRNAQADCSEKKEAAEEPAKKESKPKADKK